MDGNGGGGANAGLGWKRKQKNEQIYSPVVSGNIQVHTYLQRKEREKNQTNEQTSIYSITSDLGALENKITSSSSSSG